MTKIKLALGVAVIGIAMYGGWHLAQVASTTEYNQVVEKAVEETARRYETQIQEHKGDVKEVVEQLQDEVVARLQRDESGGKESGDRLVYTNDPSSANAGKCARVGGLRDIECDSWGVMQFKLTTIIHFSKVLYDKDITQKEAVQIALDDEKARALAKDIIFKVEGGVWNWSAAYKDESYYAYQIPFIRSLAEKVNN